MPVAIRGQRAASHILFATSLLAIAWGAVSPLHAQTAAAVQPAPASDGKASAGVADIVVTARKRAESVQEVPMAITALGAAQIRRYDIGNLEKIASSTPQFVIGRTEQGSGATLVMRGVGSNFSSIGIEQSVAVVVDGVYYGQGRTINEGFLDLQRIEVLKGPQALLYGKNATAGVVSITTADPGAKPEYQLRAGYEFKSRNTILEGVASGPVTDTLGVRLAVRGSYMFGGYFQNGAYPTTYATLNRATGVSTVHDEPPSERNEPQTHEIVGRLTLKWEPTDRLTATLKASGTYSHNNNSSYNLVPFACPLGVSQRNAAVTCGPRFTVYQSKIPADIAKNLPFGLGQDNSSEYKSFQITNTLQYTLDKVALTSITNYNWNQSITSVNSDWMVTSLPRFDALQKTPYHSVSTELRALTSFDGPVNMMVGGSYQSTYRRYRSGAIGSGFENQQAADPANVYLSNTKDSTTNGETWSGYGQLILKPIDSIEISGGVRYTHETKDSSFVHPYANPFAPNFVQGKTISAHQMFNRWSPEATISYHPSKQVTLYASYKTGYKSGGFSNSGTIGPLTTVDDLIFDPETASGFEVGVKTTLFDRQLIFNIDAFHTKISNLQLDFFNSSVVSFSTINAGSATTKGVEANFEFAPRALSGFDVHGSVAYDEARYGHTLAPCYTGQTPAQGCTTLTPFPQQDLAGLPTALAPNWTGALGVNYKWSPSDQLRASLSVDSRYSGSYLTSPFANPLSRQSRYATLDAALRLGTADDRWQLALIGQNLTNHFYVTGEIDAPGTGSGTGTAAGRSADQIGLAALPRTVQLQLTFRY